MSMTTPRVTSPFIGCFLLFVLQSNFNNKYAVSAGTATTLKLIPAGSPFDIVEWYDRDDTMMMEVATPETTAVICTSEKIPGEASEMENKVCGGVVSFDLGGASDDGTLEVTFEAPPGFEILMDTTEPMRFEFSTHIMDMDDEVECGSRQDFQGGKDFVPTLKGSKIDGLSFFNAPTSFLKLDNCGVYTSVQFDGSSDFADARVKSVSWMVQYDSNLVQKGEHSYHYATDGPMNIGAVNVRLVPEEAGGELRANSDLDYSEEDAITDGPPHEPARLRGSGPTTSPAARITHPRLAVVACAFGIVAAVLSVT